MELFNKIIFLYKSNASFIIFMIFFKTKIRNIFFKRKIKNKKKGHKKFLITKKITQDYFSSHAYNFYKIIKKFKNFKYLEIGSFEGNSAMFVAKNFEDSKIYCVDNWFGTEEYDNLNFSIKILGNFFLRFDNFSSFVPVATIVDPTL